jgi:ADP-ribose pyrophosphatase YjhB (NUDIX family)
MSPENPVPTVGVIVFDNDNVLLVRSGKASAHVTGSYGLPAGRIEPGEDEVSAARRELQEKTGRGLRSDGRIYME